MAKMDIRVVVMRLLATREHSQAELRRKLSQRGFAEDEIAVVLTEFADKNLQSEQRFIENYIDSRQRRGMGPLRILAELRERGIAEAQVTSLLNLKDPHWLLLAQQVRQKKYGSDIPEDFDERVRQMRFLEYRGFTHEQLRRILNTADDIA